MGTQQVMNRYESHITTSQPAGSSRQPYVSEAGFSEDRTVQISEKHAYADRLFSEAILDKDPISWLHSIARTDKLAYSLVYQDVTLWNSLKERVMVHINQTE